MSYCVNCGVELSDHEKRCPLCDTIVLNPQTIGLNQKISEQELPKKGVESISGFHMDFKMLANIISVLLIIPIGVTFICNYMELHKLTWSLYVLGAAILVFVIVLLPAFFKNKKPYAYIIIDAVAVFLYLYMINLLRNSDWTFTIALPICSMTMIFALFYAFAIRSKRISKLLKVTIFILFTGIYLMAIEVVLKDALHDKLALTWSHYALIPCAAVSIALIIIESNKKLKSDLQKRLFM